MIRLLALVLTASSLLAAGGDPPSVGEVGTSLAAKRACSGIFLGGRSIDSIRAEEFAPETPMDVLLGPQLKFVVDRESQTVTVSGFGAERTALYRPGLGSVLLGAGSVARLLNEDANVPRSRLGLDMETAWPLGDGDAVASELEPAIQQSLMSVLDEAFAEPEQTGRRRTRAVLVLQHGKIVAERYATGFGQESRLEGWSMTKSILNALVGIRVGQGEIQLTEDHLLPQWSGNDDGRAKLTVDHLLRMTTGLDWDENYTKITADPVLMLFMEPDIVSFASAPQLAMLPDTRWMYSSGTSNILSGVLRATFEEDETYHAFPRRALFDKIGMRSAVLECDPNGTFVGSSYCWATARDWARFGLLFLNDGKVAGERVLPEGWVARTTEPTAGSRGKYGRHWWLNSGHPDASIPRTFPRLPADMFYANGFEDQIVAVIPSRELVIVRLGCTKVRSAFSLQSFLAGIVDALE